MNKPRPEETFFEQLADRTEQTASAHPAPSRLKSRIYSALLEQQQQSGPLATLEESKAGGRDLCVFEEMGRLAALGAAAKSFNYCRICHARVLGERVENAPIFWGGCPYVQFQNR